MLAGSGLKRTFDVDGKAMSENGTANNFDRLLAHRVEIAEFVNSFTSERVQRSAFAAVVSSLGLEMPLGTPAERRAPARPLVREEPPAEPGADSAGEAAEASAEGGASRRRRNGRSGAKRSYTIPKGLNFAPDGEQSLESFIEEKQPRNQDEKNLVACFYLARMMHETVDTEHVLAVYQAAKWIAPSQPNTSLQKTASKYGWLDTADMKAIKVVWQGENYIGRMPIETKKKSS